MEHREIIQEVSRRLGIPAEAVEKMVNSYYDDVYSALRHKKGGLIYVKEVGAMRIKNQKLVNICEEYMERIQDMIQMREGDKFVPFTQISGYVRKCHDLIDELGSIVISQVEYHYNVFLSTKTKLRNRIETDVAIRSIKRLDQLIGLPFTAEYCKAENPLEAAYVQRMHEQGILQAFRKKFGIPDPKVQRVWLCDKVEDSLQAFQMPEGVMGRFNGYTLETYLKAKNVYPGKK